MSEETGKVIFKKSGRSARIFGRDRKREAPSSEDEEEEDQSEMATDLKKKARRKNPMIQSTRRGGEKSSKNKTTASSSSSSSEDSEAEERAKLLSGHSSHSYSSSGLNRAGPSDMGATARNEIDTEYSIDAQAQFERVQNALKAGVADDKIYRGQAMYGATLKQDTAAGNASSGLVRKGPIRSTQFMRPISRWDFAPDICKDYKETGYCTFGDSCKFLHDRSDYKHGWELEQDYKDGKKEENDDAYLVEDEGEQLPFKCVICRESFVNPIVTKCKHYFCEKCALERFRKTQKCFVCDQNTQGVFNPAKEIISRLAGEKKKNRRRESSNDRSSNEEDNAEEEEERQKAMPDTEMQMLDEENGEESTIERGEEGQPEEKEEEETGGGEEH